MGTRVLTDSLARCGTLGTRGCDQPARVHVGSRAGRLFLVVVGLGLVVAGCGSSAGTRSKGLSAVSATTGTATRPSPTLVVSPSTGLVGGEQLRVNLKGFPLSASVAIYECSVSPPPGGMSGCGGTASFLYTASSGTASGQFIAQPAAASGPNAAMVPCQDQCVLVAIVTKVGPRPPSYPSPMATAPLSFSSTASPGLADAFVQDLSWVSTTQGWALAAQPCLSGTCARVASTTDGGASWQSLPNPPAQFQSGTVNCSKVACVTQVSFANPHVGYLYGPSLLVTDDGGGSWQVQSGPQVETLSVADGNVYRVVYGHSGCPGPCKPTLQEAPIGSGDWHTLIGQLNYPDRSDSAQIVNSGSTLLVAMYGSQAGPVSAQAILYRSSDGGASWQQQTDPCTSRGSAGTSEEDLIDLTAAPGGFFAGLCSPHSGSGTFIVRSVDGGRSWQTAGTLPAGQNLTLVGAASPTNVAVATGAISGNGSFFTARLLVSTDSGAHWTTAATDTEQLTQTPAGVPAWLGFETSRVGRWVGDPHNVWTTLDGGRHWTKSAFG